MDKQVHSIIAGASAVPKGQIDVGAEVRYDGKTGVVVEVGITPGEQTKVAVVLYDGGFIECGEDELEEVR